MKTVIRKSLALFTAFALVFSAVFFFVSPSSAEETVYSAFTKPSQEVDSELLYKNSRVLDTFSDVSAWKGGTSVKSVARSTYSGGTSCLLATADGDRQLSLSVSREMRSDNAYSTGGSDAIPTEGYRELSFSFLALGSTDLAYELRVTLFSESAEAVYTANLIPNDWQDVFLDLDMLEGQTLRAISVTITGTSAEAYVTSAALSSLALGDISHSELSRRYSALYVYGGEITQDAVKVTPKDQKATVRAEALIPDAASSEQSTVMITLTLRGVGYAKLRVLTSAAPAWRESEYTEMSSLTVTSDTNTYVCCFTQKGALASWALSFSEISTVEDSSFYIDSISITLGARADSDEGHADESLGKVTKCTYSGTELLQISGTVSHSAAVEYIDGKLGLYMIPGWQNTAGALDGEPVLTSDVSTEFVFKLSLEAFPTAPGCRFAVVLMKDGRKSLITDKVRPAISAPMTQAQLPKLVVSSEHDDRIFTYGAQGVAIDVDISKIIRPANDSGTRLAVWGDSFFYFNQSILSAIASKAEFYTACGMKYYFRLICSTDKYATAGGLSAAFYAIDVSDRLNYDMTAALVNLLSDRFSPAGYILGDRLNVSDRNATLSSKDMFTLMKQSADSARLIYSIASRKNPYTVLILPFEAVNDLAAETNTRSVPPVHSAVSCAALADMYISEQGDTPIKWASLVYADGRSVTDIPSQSAAQSSSGYLGAAITPSSAEETTYAELTQDFPSALFYYLPLGENVTETLEVQALVPEVRRMPYSGDMFAGSLYLWDFRRSFSTEKWVCSGSSKLTTSVSTALTSAGELLSSRALRIDLHSDSTREDETVIASATLPADISLSGCRYVEFRLAASASSGGAEFEIHLGDSSGRWYYPVRLPDSEAHSVLCRLPDGVSPTYFALSARGKDNVTLELGEVLAHSDTLTSAELERRSVRSDADPKVSTEKEHRELLLRIAAATITGLSIVVFTALNRLHRQKRS